MLTFIIFIFSWIYFNLINLKKIILKNISSNKFFFLHLSFNINLYIFMF